MMTSLYWDAMSNQMFESPDYGGSVPVRYMGTITVDGERNGGLVPTTAGAVLIAVVAGDPMMYPFEIEGTHELPPGTYELWGGYDD